MIAKIKSSPYYDITLFFLMGLGVIVSLQMAWVQGFFHDGYLYASFGKNASEQGHWLIPHLSPFGYGRFEQHLPTLFILEGLFFKVFGSSYISARTFISLFFLMTGFGVFKWALKKEGKTFSYYALFLFFSIPPLIKKVRFPNLDIALMCFIFWGFYFYSKSLTKNNLLNWSLVGLSFGLSLLIKGPVGLLLPIGIFCHLLGTKDIKTLFQKEPWLGLTLGLALFSLWPLILYLTNNFDIFLDWFKFTFVITIKNSRGVSNPFWTYLVFLLKQTHLWIILLVLGFSKYRKDKSFGLAFYFFISMLTFLSIPEFKYSNYLIPLYPFLSISAAYGVKSLGEHYFKNLYKGFIPFIFVGSLILLIFPLTNVSRRDHGVRSFKKLLKGANIKEERWVNVGGVYSGIGLTSLNVWEGNVPTMIERASVILDKWRNEDFLRSIIVASHRDASLLKKKFSFLKQAATIKNYSVVILMHKDYLFISKSLSL